MMDSGLQLIHRYARDRDPEAFASIVRDYQDMVYRVCLRIHGNAHQAEDSAQECFLRLARNARQVTCSLSGWLHRCATRVSLDAIRRQKARVRRERAYVEMTNTVSEKEKWDEIAPVLDQALDALPDDLREVLVQRFLLQRSQAEIAERLDASPATVSRRTKRAIEALRGNLKKAGIAAGAAALSLLLAKNASAGAAPAGLAANLGKAALAGVGGTGGAPEAALAASKPAMSSTAKYAIAWAACILVAATGYLASRRDRPAATSEAEEPTAQETAAPPVWLTADPLPAPEEPPPPVVIAEEALPVPDERDRPAAADVVADAPAVPTLDEGDVSVAFAFEENDNDLVWVANTDPGLIWTIQNGEGRLAGVTADAAWMGNHFGFPIGIDIRAGLEISGEFRIADQDGYHLVALWGPPDMGASRICMFYQSQGRRPDDGHYVIQTRWMDAKTTRPERSTLPAFGDEAETFHKMRMVLDRTTRTIAYYVDDTLIGVVSYEGEIMPVTSVGMDLETPREGTTLDVRYDNVRARSFGPMYRFPEEN